MTVQEVFDKLQGVLTQERIENGIVNYYKEVFIHFRLIRTALENHKKLINPLAVKQRNYTTLIAGLLTTINVAMRDIQQALKQN